jgi:hypothetical protein
MDLSQARWHKSTRSSDTANCVEVAENLPDVVAVRDTKDRDGGILTFTHDVWGLFVAGVKAGEFDL